MARRASRALPERFLRAVIPGHKVLCPTQTCPCRGPRNTVVLGEGAGLATLRDDLAVIWGARFARVAPAGSLPGRVFVSRLPSQGVEACPKRLEPLRPGAVSRPWLPSHSRDTLRPGRDARAASRGLRRRAQGRDGPAGVHGCRHWRGPLHVGRPSGPSPPGRGGVPRPGHEVTQELGVEHRNPPLRGKHAPLRGRARPATSHVVSVGDRS